jgi:hypothetical protein
VANVRDGLDWEWFRSQFLPVVVIVFGIVMVGVWAYGG